MNFKYFFIFILFINFSCSDQKETSDQAGKTTSTALTLEEMVYSHVEKALSIPKSEKYSLKIYKNNLDGDDKMDAIITVNRLEYALKEAKESGIYNLREKMGFNGSFNYIFYFDGGLNLISPEIIMPSCPQSELKIEFKSILSEICKDVIVDFKIQNASFRSYISIRNHNPKSVFQWKVYDNLGEENESSIYFDYDEGTVGLAKDILIYKGKIENSKNVKDLYSFNPEISKTDELLHRFFYFESEGKYFTKK